MIDLDTLNPDWELAARHAKAVRAANPVSEHSHIVCSCCFNPIEKEDVSLLENPKEL